MSFQARLTNLSGETLDIVINSWELQEGCLVLETEEQTIIFPTDNILTFKIKMPPKAEENI